MFGIFDNLNQCHLEWSCGFHYRTQIFFQHWLKTRKLIWAKPNLSKELIVDFRKRRAKQAPINIDGAVVEWVESFKFLIVHISNKLSWYKHTKTIVKRAWQHLFPLRRLKRFVMGRQIIKKFYSCTTWYGNCSSSDRKALQRVVRIAGAKLPAIQDLSTRWCERKVQKIVRLQSPES